MFLLQDIVQKLSCDGRQVASLSRHSAESCLVTMMAAAVHDASLLHCILRSLINFTHQSVFSSVSLYFSVSVWPYSRVKGQVLPYRALGHELILVYRQATRIGNFLSHPLGGRLPLLYTRPVVTFAVEEHHHPSAGTKLYCLVTEAHVYENRLSKAVTWKQASRDLNPRLFGSRVNTLPFWHTVQSNLAKDRNASCHYTPTFAGLLYCPIVTPRSSKEDKLKHCGTWRLLYVEPG